MPTDLLIGMTVHTLDGDELGTIKEIRGDIFKVDAPMEPDYWLQCAHIRGSLAGGIEVDFDKDRLSEFKRDTTLI